MALPHHDRAFPDKKELVTVPTTLNPYLGFRDTARHAMEFYRGVFGGELKTSPFGGREASEDPAEKEKVMH